MDYCAVMLRHGVKTLILNGLGKFPACSVTGITQRNGMAYTKLFASIVTSTIWTADDKTRIVWITMMALADKNGEVHASIPGLARVAGVDLAACEAAITAFLSPDPYSRTPDEEGRRIEKIDGGWALLNHSKYRLMASKDEAKASNAERQRRFRERKAKTGEKVTRRDEKVTENNGSVTQGRDIAEAEAEAEVVSPTSKQPPLPPKGDGDRKKGDNLPTTAEALKIAALYRRRPTTPWHPKEIKAFKALSPIDPSDLDLVIRYEQSEMEKGDLGWHKRDLGTFLNQFGTELDRAKAWEAKPLPKSKFSGMKEDLEMPDA